jgi:regulator of ribonuclease activity A
MHFETSDLCDKYQTKVQVLAPKFISYGGKDKVHGKIATCKLIDNNNELIKLLKTDGENRVCIVDVEAKYTAVVGDKLMGLARENNWSGILVNGYVRDIVNTKKIDVGLWALGTCPQKSPVPNTGECDVDVYFGDVEFIPGDYFYADKDGIIISDEELYM